MAVLKLSLCITTYNRPELTAESFAQVYNDERIDEIIIFDDKSEDHNIRWLQMHVLENDPLKKIHLWESSVNEGMQINKLKVVKAAKNDWCILFDSDNILEPKYIDAFYNHLKLISATKPRPYLIYCPDFAKPNFDYRQFAGTTYYAIECARHARLDMFNCLLNTCNYIVNRHAYARMFVQNSEHVASDTIWFNYNWLKAGNGFYVVPGMEYYHRVHKDSGFMQNAQYNMQKSAEVRNLIMEL
jgi:glycosyltransferase involved in cell wall biosynthesis